MYQIETELTRSVQGFGISWSGVLLFDLLVFLLTARVGLREFRHTSSKLWQTIFYNGALYFLYVPVLVIVQDVRH